MKLLLPFFFLFFSQFTFCQYEPLQSAGDVPADFTTSSFDKYKKELAKVDKSAKRRTRKNQKDFFLESNYGIDDLLKSGYVMFNDPVTNYINDIADVLLKDDLKTRKKIRIYAVRTPSVNAFATNQGVILVNMGLISQLENEAQLAFILAHEISHFKEQHALEFYLESKEIEREGSRGFLKRSTLDSKLAKNNFSKEQESEADELGLDIYLKSNYDLEAIQGAFDVLQYSYLSFAEVAFNKSYFEDEYLLFPKKYQLDSIIGITTEFDDDDTESTHPSLPKRRKAADDIIGKNSNEGRNKFIVSQSRFEELRTRARYDLLEYNLRNFQYYDAIYNAYLLEFENPNDLYLKSIIAKALYGMTKLKNARKFSDYELDEDKMEGEFGTLVHFFNKLKKYELNALALRYTYLLKDKFSDNPIWDEMVEDLCQDFINKHSRPFKRFKKGNPADLPKEPELKAPAEDASDEEKSKYEKIRAQRKEAEESIFVYYAFGDLMEQDEFNAMIEKCQKIKKKNKEDEETEQFGSTGFMSESRRLRSRGKYALGEKKILMINPFYVKLSRGFRETLLIKTEKAQQKFSEIIQENADRLDLKIVMLDAAKFGKNDVEELNDLRIIQEWFGHQMEMDDDLQMIAFNQERVNKIAKKYGVDTFVWTGVVTGKTSRSSLEVLGLLFINPIHWVYNTVTPKGESIIFSMALDAESGDPRMGTFDLVKTIDNKDVLKQRVYDILAQIAKKRKNRKK